MVLNGFVGLISLTLAMLLPAGLFLARFPIERWNQPGLAPVAVIATIVDLFLLDCLVNAMPNVIYVIAAGGLFNIVPSRTRSQTSDHGDDSHARVARTEETLAAQYRARGRASKDQGRLVEAKTAWLHALDLHTKLTAADPGRPALHQQWCDCANDLAWLLVNAADPAVKDPALALSLAVRTTEMYPECSTYWNTLGASYYRTGDFKAASRRPRPLDAPRRWRHGLRPCLLDHDTRAVGQPGTSSSLVRRGNALDGTTSPGSSGIASSLR